VPVPLLCRAPCQRTVLVSSSTSSDTVRLAVALLAPLGPSNLVSLPAATRTCIGRVRPRHQTASPLQQRGGEHAETVDTVVDPPAPDSRRSVPDAAAVVLGFIARAHTAAMTRRGPPTVGARTAQCISRPRRSPAFGLTLSSACLLPRRRKSTPRDGLVPDQHERVLPGGDELVLRPGSGSRSQPFLGNCGYLAIAERLTAEQIPPPSGHDRLRNPHRLGFAWSK
jgi:hypothetical protein